MSEKSKKQEIWDEVWGNMDYCSDQFTQMMSEIDNKLGEVVVDVGAGANPVTRLLDRTRHKVIEVDCSSDETSDLPNTLRVRFDIDEIVDNRDSTRLAIAKVMKFLDIDENECGFSPKSLERVDAFVFSQILNHIDFKAVIKSLKKYLKPGGELIFNECIGLGVKETISGEGLTDFDDFAKFIVSEGYITSRPSRLEDRFLWRVQKPKLIKPV